METVKLPKGTVVKVNGVPCELAEDAEVKSATIAGMGVDAFLRWSEDGHGEPQDEWPEWIEDQKYL
jgi:tRNA A22 N-methylase